MSASLSGFKKYVNNGVTLQVNETTRLDISLSVGDTSEQVTVTADAPLLEAESSGRGAVIDQQKIVELPLNGRDYNQLATLSPGVLLPTPRLQSIGFKGVFNVNGNRAFQNAFLLDGVDNTSYSNSYRGGNIQIVQPSVDALQEFKIQTNAYSAEFGRSAGALVNAVIKSGSNQLHGSAYEFFRNRELDAANFFSNKTASPKPFRLRNQFGFTAGGPIVKNKTFIFGDYEGLRDRAGLVRFTSVPQTAWLQARRQRIFHSSDRSNQGRIRSVPGFRQLRHRHPQRTRDRKPGLQSEQDIRAHGTAFAAITRRVLQRIQSHQPECAGRSVGRRVRPDHEHLHGGANHPVRAQVQVLVAPIGLR